MIRLLYTLLALIFTTSAMAQTDSLRVATIEPATIPVQVDSVRLNIVERLARPVQVDSLTTITSTVHFEAKGDAATIVEKGLISKEAKSVNGYRIVIFMNNSQNARRDAFAAQESFKSLYPTETTYLTYDNPYFKVMVGNYTSQEEATIHLGSIRRSFPKAFIMRESIPIGEFAK